MSSFLPKSLPQNTTLLFWMAQIDILDHAESTNDVQEKKARNYKLQFIENQNFVNFTFGAHFD